jgi:hypothetical protein
MNESGGVHPGDGYDLFRMAITAADSSQTDGHLNLQPEAPPFAMVRWTGQ